MAIDWSKPLEVLSDGKWVDAYLNEKCSTPDSEGDFCLKSDADLEYHVYHSTGQAWLEGYESEIIVRNKEETVAMKLPEGPIETVKIAPLDDDQFPADWAIDRALVTFVKCHPSTGWKAQSVKETASKEDPAQGFALTVLEYARLIEKHEHPPVDPELLIAREVCALWYEGRGVENAAIEYRSGFYDAVNDKELTIALTAIRLVREGWKP